MNELNIYTLLLVLILYKKRLHQIILKSMETLLPTPPTIRLVKNQPHTLALAAQAT